LVGYDPPKWALARLAIPNSYEFRQKIKDNFKGYSAFHVTAKEWAIFVGNVGNVVSALRKVD
jgi:hypothetical protein